MNMPNDEIGSVPVAPLPTISAQDRAVRLNEAAVALIEPLMGQFDQAQVLTRLADAVQRCAMAADALGLRSLNYLAALVAPFLKQHAHSPMAPADREAVDNWVGDLVAFCAGQMAGQDSQQLVTGLSSWPDFPKVPLQFVELIGERLRADAVVIAGWNMPATSTDHASMGQEVPGVADLAGYAAAADVPRSEPPGPAPQREPEREPVAGRVPFAEREAIAEHEAIAGTDAGTATDSETDSETETETETETILEPMPAVEPIPAAADSVLAPAARAAMSPPLARTAPPLAEPVATTASVGSALVADDAIVMARDELDMLADAAEALGADVIPQLLSMSLPTDRDAQRQDWTDLLEEFESRVGHLGNAAGYVGATALVELLHAVGEQVRAWRMYGAPINEDARRLLMLAPDTLARYFGSPQRETADELAGLMADPGWPQPLAIERCGSLAVALASLKVIDSRQVALDDREISEDDLSLEIPADADRSVVEHLLLELPALSGEFSDSVDALRGGSLPELQRAQRLAHTLKGSANTVGVRGIANLTHRLEDILQLLVKADRLPPRALRDHLAEAADCLAEMCEAVAGVGAAPEGAMSLYRQSVEWVNRLLQDGVPDEGTSADAALPGADGPQGRGEALANASADQVRATGDARQSPDDAVPEPPHSRTGSGADHDAMQSSAALIEPDAPFEGAAGAGVAPLAAEGDLTDSVRGRGEGLDAVSQAAGPVEPVESRDAALASANPPAEAAERTLVATPEEELLRVPGKVVDRLLDVTGEAVITLAQLHQQIALVDATRTALRAGSERLQDLSAELERLVDIRGLALTGRGRDQRFDALELDEYNDLHTVSRRIAEAAADNKLLDQQFDRQVGSLRDFAAQLERIQTDLREQSMRTRMVPMATVSARLQRAMRQAARMAGKQAALTIRGEDTEIDAHLLQSLVDPLTHMLRNAIDHGIESESERIRLGKPVGGQIEASFHRDASSLVIDIRDDGRGLDLAAIRARATALGLIDDAAPPPDADLLRLILLPGFSTRREATQLSGRGIGLNVVHQRLNELRGRIDLASERGRGTAFRLSVPLRMAAVPVMVARCATHVLALSVRDIEHIARIDELIDSQALAAAGLAGGSGVTHLGPRVRCGDRVYDAVYLESLLRLPPAAFAREDGRQVALIVRQADREPFAVVAPELEQSRNVILRPLPPVVPPIGGVGGIAVLGDGSAAPVIDLPDLIAHREDPVTQYAQSLAANVDTRPVCLVVDDSVSVRRSMELFLRDLGLQVDSAGDGLEALACVDRRVPDLVIADLEMPRMNGVELTAALRAAPATAGVPVIMITSRYSDKHKAAAMGAGVDVFMTKPYTEDELAGHVQRTLFRAMN